MWGSGGGAVVDIWERSWFATLLNFTLFFCIEKMRLRTLSSTPLLYPTPTPSPQIDDLIHDYISS